MKIRFRELKIEQIEIYKVPGSTLESMNPCSHLSGYYRIQLQILPGYLESMYTWFQSRLVNWEERSFSISAGLSQGFSQ